MFNLRRLRLCLATALLALTPLAAPAQSARGITVLAASSLTNAIAQTRSFRNVGNFSGLLGLYFFSASHS
jgi:ABC-type molybdate transport system substrate-binding protein